MDTIFDEMHISLTVAKLTAKISVYYVLKGGFDLIKKYFLVERVVFNIHLQMNEED